MRKERRLATIFVEAFCYKRFVMKKDQRLNSRIRGENWIENNQLSIKSDSS